MKLHELFGQEAAVGAIRRALEAECLAGTYLIVGPDGAGKYRLAQAFAQAAACLTPRQDPFDACGECESCRRAASNSHPEIAVVRPAGEQIQIWQLWDRQGRQAPGVLSRTLSYAPAVGKRRVYILEKCDRLTESAANSLLKVLEEPPPYALFLLLAPHAARVLPTIVSRCQMIRLQLAAAGELACYLEAHLDVEPGRAAMLASYAEGRVGQAVTLARSPVVGEEIARILDFAESLPAAPAYRALKTAEQLRKLAGQTKALLGEEPTEGVDGGGEESDAGSAREKTGRRQFAAVLDLLVTFYRDLLAAGIGMEEHRLVNRERALTLARLKNHGDCERWSACLDALLLARRRLDANANVQLVTDVLMMRLLQP